MPALTEGTRAPDFTLETSTETPFSLSEALKQNRFVVLAFYPAAFSSVCTSEMSLFQEVQDEFRRLRALVVGISVDGRHTQHEFARQNGITFPLLADFHPKGAVAQQYGVMGGNGVAERALFIVDSDGLIRYSHVSEARTNPGADRLLERLDELQSERS